MPTVTYTLRLHCSNCSAEIAVNGQQGGEKIRWRIDGKVTALRAKARKWLHNNPKAQELRYGEVVRPHIPEELRNVIYTTVALDLRARYIEFHFLDCPACGGRAYVGSAVSPPQEST